MGYPIGMRAYSLLRQWYGNPRIIAAFGVFLGCSLGWEKGQANPVGRFDTITGKQYSRDAISIVPGSGDAKLKVAFQALKGRITSEGLWLKSTAKDEKGIQPSKHFR
ncbi:MAG TPA: hypothetical protein VIM48_04940, partial [Chthoniobacterales bacterium]